MADAPIVIGYDGSPASGDAVDAAARLFPGRTAVVVVVFEAEHAYDTLVDVPDGSLAPLDSSLDYQGVIASDHVEYQGAQRLAQQGVDRARAAGLAAEGMATVDVRPAADVLVRLATERDAPALVVGSHGHHALHELFARSTTRDLIRPSPCPVVVIRGPDR